MTDNSKPSFSELSLADKFRLRWKLTARPNQITPEGEWVNWLCLAGRGWGKTRTGGEDVGHFGVRHPESRIALVGPTYPDARDTMVEGESGLLSCIPPSHVADWNRSIGELILTNGTIYKLYTAEKPDRLRGPQHHRAWCDEVGAWKYPTDTWDMLQLGMRLGKNPQTVITSTPRPIKLIRDLVSDPDTVLSTGSTYENKENLPASFIKTIIKKYEGTRLGQQELYAQLLDDTPGALWERKQIDKLRIRNVDPREFRARCVRVVVAVDPSVTSTEDADETGIVVCGYTEAAEGLILADGSLRGTPREWGSKVVELYHDFSADRIIGETNNGGDLVEEVIRMIDMNVAYKKITASKGKYVRAEPISALYEQGRVHHVGMFELLEDQMCMFTPDNIAKQSPDRADALVWGLTELFDGCMNLGVLAYAQSIMAAKAKLIKPVTVDVQVLCPTCGSAAVMTMGRGKRCNQCGAMFGEPEAVPGMVINRTSVMKVQRRLK